jgi:glutathione S-transferase
MRLYNSMSSPYCARVRLAIYAKDLHGIELAPRLPVEQLRAFNPFGKVPCLVMDDGMVVPESQVIVEYLEDRFPTPPLRPLAPEARATMRLVARACDVYLLPALVKLLPHLRLPASDSAALETALAEINRLLGVVDGFVPERGHAAGPIFSLADCALVPTVKVTESLLSRLGQAEPLASAPHIAAWWERTRLEPAVARVLAEMDEGLARILPTPEDGGEGA